MLQPGVPDVVADGRAAFAEDHMKVSLRTTQGCRYLIDAKVGIAKVLAYETLCPNVNGFRSRTVEHPVGFAQRQQQEIDQRFGNAGRRVRRQARRLVER